MGLASIGIEAADLVWRREPEGDGAGLVRPELATTGAGSCATLTWGSSLMNWTGSLRNVLTPCVAVALMAGCGGGDSSKPGGSKPATTVIVDGSSTVFRISRAAKDAFRTVDPAVVVVVDNHGTGGGFGRYLRNEADIVDASRVAKPDEEAKAKEQGIDWTRFVVGLDGITLVVNPRNDFVKSLSVEQLRAMWEPSSKVKTWKDVDPSWPDRKIVFYSPDNDSGTFEFFTEAITGKARAQRDGVQQSSDDNTLVLGVSGDSDGLGYFGYAYYAANKDKLRALAVSKGPDGPSVMPSPATIADKSYVPLSRPLFIYVKNSAARRPEVAAFVKYYVSNSAKLAVKAGYDAPTAEDEAANQAALARLFADDDKAQAKAEKAEKVE
jgi:phosphate transport system substrate-binding protein